VRSKKLGKKWNQKTWKVEIISVLFENSGTCYPKRKRMNEISPLNFSAPNKQFQKHCGHLSSNIFTHGDGIADVHDDGSVAARFDLERVALESAGRIRRVG
jgi:hypothetical protein